MSSVVTWVLATSVGVLLKLEDGLHLREVGRPVYFVVYPFARESAASLPGILHLREVGRSVYLVVPSFARESAASLPGILQWKGARYGATT